MQTLSARTTRKLAALGRIGSSTRLGAWLAAQVVGLLIKKHRLEEADVLLEAARAAGGRSISIASAYALVAQARGHHSEAVIRWNDARRLGAKEPFASSRLAANLRVLGEHSAAQTVVDDALARYPEDIRILSEAARLAQDRDRPYDAAALWCRAIRRAKPHKDWLQCYGLNLYRAGDLDRANRVVASARRQYPHCLELMALHGWIANAREDWARAIVLWTEHCRRVPDGTVNWEALGRARYGAQITELKGNRASMSVRADIVTLDDEPTRRLLLGFESLGDSCEVGLVQRRYGAEPLGLLRWNNVGIDNLIAALDHGFKGMGEPDNTEMITTANGELFFMDRRWGLSMQTFMFANQVDPDDFYRKMCRRIVYLRDKLLDDLKAGDKIFVYRSEVIGVDWLRRLHHALLAHGPVILLCVQPGQPVGEVERLGEGLYIGFLAYLGGGGIVDFDTWTSLFAMVTEKERIRSAHGIVSNKDRILA